MRHPYRTTLLVFAAVVLLTGCSTSQLFQLVLSVENQADGTPVPDAKVILDTQGVESRKFEFDYGWPHDGKTDLVGRFVHDFTVSPYPSDKPYWYLKISKDGFDPVVIDIKPDPQPPKNDQGPIPITMMIKLRPKSDPPR